jgi:hypothetical protein
MRHNVRENRIGGWNRVRRSSATLGANPAAHEREQIASDESSLALHAEVPVLREHVPQLLVDFSGKSLQWVPGDM